MPIYEFYCSDCNTIFNFFSHSIATDASPTCPKCQKAELSKRPSTFATLKYRGEDEPPTPFDNLDETRLENAMATLANEMGDLEESEDPRQLGQFFRRFGELSGLEMGPRMEETLRRLESGEDMESLEQEMGGELEDDESMDEFFKLKRAYLRKKNRPKIDDTLYFL